MDVLVLIDRLEELVEDARSFPGFGNTAMIDRDAAFDIIDQMRQTIPEELKQARWIVKERQAMLDEPRSSEITPESLYLGRREFLRNTALAAGTAAVFGGGLLWLVGRRPPPDPP